MGVFTRHDSPWYWLWLESATPGHEREKTDVKIGKTRKQRNDSRELAETLYHQRMNAIAARIHKLPIERPVIRLDKYAAIYARDVLPQHRGAVREREILRTLVRGFGAELLHTIDCDRVRQWRAQRAAVVSARTTNREIDLLKSMLRDATPKYIDASPLVGLKRLAVVPPKRRLLTPAEERKILPRLGPEDRAIFLIGLDGLCRLGDILDLRVDDDHGRTLYIRDPKDPTQGEPYEVPVSARVRKALDALHPEGIYYFATRRSGRSRHAWASAVRSALKTACGAAKVPYGWKQGGVTFHWATRRTGATRMLQRGAELKAVQAVGHWKSPDVMLSIYAESTSKAAQRAVELVSGSRSAPAQRHRDQKRA